MRRSETMRLSLHNAQQGYQAIKAAWQYAKGQLLDHVIKVCGTAVCHKKAEWKGVE